MGKKEIVFIGGIRSAFGTPGKTLRHILGEELAGMTIKGLIEKTGIIAKDGVIDSVFLGSAAEANTAINPARWAVLAAGLPQRTSASYIEMWCGSPIDPINHAAWKILAGHADIVIVGGYEAYSRIPDRFLMSTTPFRMTPPMPIPALLPCTFPRRRDDEHGVCRGSCAESV